ncbi:MAG TPA: OmpA family protein [Puia sp.]|nr:OmpA family protein [Puia sp.]
MNRPLIRLAICPALFLFFLCQRIQGQNLVPNPSFEDVNTCLEFDQPCSPSAWFYLSRKFTTGYFPRYPSATGSRHLQIVAASRESVNRQYWETMLLCPLQAGERYVVSLKVASPGSRTQLSTTCPNLRDIGFWFTGRFVFVQGDSILQPRSYLSFPGATVKDLKDGWFEVRKEFVPTSNASILVVGNFSRMENTDIMDQRNAAAPTIDVLVDDISITRIKGGACEGYQKIKDSLYSLLRRHSDPQPGDPGLADVTPRRQKTDPSDSNWHPGYGPIKDPLFGPEPRRRVDTPKSNPAPPLPRPLPPATDTIIIHNIQFDFDKYLVQDPDTVEQYRRLLTRPGIKKIQVVGFTDDAGSEAYNLDLSQKRAREVARVLSSRFNIDPSLLQVEGRGISRQYPTKYLNRRVEIYIFH